MLFFSPGIDQVPDFDYIFVCVCVGAGEPVVCLRFIQLILLRGGWDTGNAPHTFIKHPLSLHTLHIAQLNSQEGREERVRERDAVKGCKKGRSCINITNCHKMGPLCFL